MTKPTQAYRATWPSEEFLQEVMPAESSASRYKDEMLTGYETVFIGLNIEFRVQGPEGLRFWGGK